MRLAETTNQTKSEHSNEAELFAAFIDAIGRPIADLKVKIDTGDNVLDLKTDSNGTLPVINLGAGKHKGKICAVLPTGQEEVALKFELSLGMNSYVCESPYVLVTGKTFKHEGTPTPLIRGEVKKPGSTTDTRSEAGNPVKQSIVQDCPNSDNLKLTPNQQYKQFILNAAKHGDLTPQGVAALINTEAGRIVYEFEKPVLNKKGKPILNKDGKPKTKKVKVPSKEWLPTATNSKSTARGLTQFLVGTWAGQALIKGSYLNTQAMSRGYVVEETQKHKKPGKKKGTFVETESKKLIIKDKTKLLAMRDEPEISIMVSVDYGVQNFKGLAKEDFKLSGINSSEKTKLFYLMHHLGLGDAVDFINNEIEEGHAKKIFSDQIGAKAVEERAKLEENHSYVLAHRRWLIGFIDNHITPKSFSCDQSKIDEAKSLFDLVITVGGSNPKNFSI